MASIAKDKNGCRRILFVAPDGKRPTIRLGKKSLEFAREVKNKVEMLLEAKLLKRAMPAELAKWVADLEPWLAKKLVRVGLIPPREPRAAVTLGAFLDQYIEGRTDVKPLTTRHLKDARRSLVAHFGEQKPLADVTPGDADEFRRGLLERLGENTVRRQCGRAKQFFRAAVRKRLIGENPFADMTGCSVRPNRERDYFVTREDAQKVLDACPDAVWRLLFALSRYGGLRCPSEHLALRWADIDWERGRMRVRSPKTERHEGGESRVIPIFPELRPYLEAAWESAAEGSEYVISRRRSASTNLRTQLTRIIERAGLKPWPKLWHNLRASRATELAAVHPAHVAAAWLGHSTLVASKHYWQLTDADFDRAAGSPSGNQKAAQKAAQQVHADSGGDSQSCGAAQKKTPVLPGLATSCDYPQNVQVPPVGLEPTTL
jgi:integrase